MVESVALWTWKGGVVLWAKVGLWIMTLQLQGKVRQSNQYIHTVYMYMYMLWFP